MGDPELIGMHIGPPLLVHNRSECAGQHCSIHNPSDHPLMDRPLNWRGHVMERICTHGIGHPDPDDSAWRRRTGQPVNGIHGCDGCCSGRRLPDTEPVRGPVDVDKTVLSPGTPQQVDSLNAFQASGKFHPYTCPHRGNGNHPAVEPYDRGMLVATTGGWACPNVRCDYTQTWAHRFTADWSWRQSGCITGL